MSTQVPNETGEPMDDGSSLFEFQVISDCHLESRQTDFVVPQKARVLLLAGDIGNIGDQRQRVKYTTFIKQQCATFEHVFLVLGNAESRFTSIPKAEETLRVLAQLPDCAGKLHVMEKTRFDLPDENISILGTTMWSDLGNSTRIAPGDGQIENNSEAKHNERYRESIAWIRKQVKRIRRKNPSHKILIITHHAPTVKGSNKPGFDNRAARNWRVFQTDILGGEGVEGLRKGDVWVHGHTHFTHDSYHDGVRVFANQVGRQTSDHEAFRHENTLRM